MAKAKKKEEAKKELAVVANNDAVVSVIQNRRDAAGGQGASTDQADNVTPLLKVLQPLSPQCLKQKKDDYIDSAEAGMLWPRGEKQVWSGEEGVRVVNAYYERVWMEWGPTRGDGLKGRHARGTDETPKQLGAVLKPDENGRDVWTMPNGNKLQDNRQHVVLVLDKYDEPMPFVLPMSGSNIGTSRNWHPHLNKHKTKNGVKGAAYEFVYLLKTVARSNDKGDWFQFAIEPTGERVSDDVWDAADEIYNRFKAGDLVADVDAGDNEAANDSDVI